MDFEKLERQRARAIREISTATDALNAELHLGLSSLEVQWAVADVIGTEGLDALIEQCPDAATIVRLLRNFPFQKFRPQKLESIELDEDIIPMDVPRHLEEQRIRVNGNIWVIHRNDADPFPSTPHAHNYQQQVKLDLTNGNLFRNRQFAGTVKRKHLLELRRLIKHPDLPPLAAGDED